jgi:hypothetical protein
MLAAKAAMASAGPAFTAPEPRASTGEESLHIRKAEADSAVTADTGAGSAGDMLPPMHRAESPALLPGKHAPLAELTGHAPHFSMGGIQIAQSEQRSPESLTPIEMDTHLTSSSPAVQPADGSIASSAAFNVFSQMDSVVVQDRHTPFGMAKTLEVGFQDSGSGAVGVHAHLIGGQVSAVIQVDKEQARSSLAHELPAVEQFLSLAHVEVKQVSVDLGDQGSRHPAHSEQETASGQRSGQPFADEPVTSPQELFPASISTQQEAEVIPLLSVEA